MSENKSVSIDTVINWLNGMSTAKYKIQYIKYPIKKVHILEQRGGGARLRECETMLPDERS